MPRENKEPFDCYECRFKYQGACLRNPPTPVWMGNELQTFYPSIPATGCFAGEPKEQEEKQEEQKPELEEVECCYNCLYEHTGVTHECVKHEIDIKPSNKCKEYERE